MTKLKIALIGNPNSGKTTLFNALTGSKQQVGNWPGVTVERKTGVYHYQQASINVIDLPGIYSLSTMSDANALDEKIANQALTDIDFDLVINIVDATNLERNLYLTTQLLELDIPVIVALNMMDAVDKNKQRIDIKALAGQLSCPVLPISASQKRGLEQLKAAIIDLPIKSKKPIVCYPENLTSIIDKVANIIGERPNQRALAIRALETNEAFAQAAIDTSLTDDADILIADARYQFISNTASQVLQKTTAKVRSFTQLLDKIVLNRYLGIPIFFFAMYVMFIFAINIGGAFQDFFDIGSNTIFVNGFAHVLQSIHTPTWLIAILAAGFGKGINTVITFTPIIAGMFLFLAFLEGSGYMARAAFVMDRFMRAIGLPGKSFVPMIVGFGCNVPAIMATRTLENRRDRILTILMSPFMSCGARLAIFAVFTAAFFPEGGQNVVFALYIIGIVVAVLTGLILRRTLLQGKPSPLVMELPPYRMPTVRAMGLQTWRRLKGFLFKAGKLIIPICILIGALNTFNIDGSLNDGEGSQESMLSVLGKTVTPVFHPMGLEQNNWPATVGLLTGLLAKEVVIATLNTLYTQSAGLQTAQAAQFNFWRGIDAALVSVPNNLVALKDSFKNPILASAPPHDVDRGVLGVMYSRFHGQLGAFAYLLFVLLYFPCVSTTAAMLRELNRRWAVFSACWNTGFAYGVAVVFYQTVTFAKHPVYSASWIAGILLTFFATLLVLKRYANVEPTQPRPVSGGQRVSI